MHTIGDRIKKRREYLNVPSNDLANAIGVSSSLISQIERAKAFPSILTLMKIADELQTTVGELIGEYESLVENPLLKVEDRKFVKKNDQGARLYLLSHHDPKKEMDTFMIEFSKNGDSSNIMTSKNPRQEFCYVLKGIIKVKLNTKEYKLEEGDSFYFNSSQYHLFFNIGEENAQMLWIVNQ
jgi:transcriptional regulator with XRE-family HTH domain